MNKERVLHIHNQLEKLALCREGILKPELLDSAIEGQQWYDNIFDKYLHVASSINAYHIFNDGNKRTCYIIIKDLAEYRYYFDEDKLSDLILSLAKSEISKDTFMEKAKECIRV